MFISIPFVAAFTFKRQNANALTIRRPNNNNINNDNDGDDNKKIFKMFYILLNITSVRTFGDSMATAAAAAVAVVVYLCEYLCRIATMTFK